MPTVIALINGQPAPLFQGVLAKDQVNAAIDQLLKAAVANGMVGRAQPVGAEAPPETEPEPEADPRYAAADAALERGDFAEARDEFDKLLEANPNDVEAQAGKARQASLPAPQRWIPGRPSWRRMAATTSTVSWQPRMWR